MELKNFIAHGDIYDIYECDGKSINVYNKPEYKEKCLYAALTHARCETTMVNSFIKTPILHEVSVVDGKWAICFDFIKGKTLQQLMDENPDKMDTYLNQFIDIQMEIHAQ
ncbi:MAG TPA: aminoglycoside phosphotransferase, partial [Ruminococcus sp.]|nr:aminoglycoside phosphotransferase [Ruminococcus sp.]